VTRTRVFFIAIIAAFAATVTVPAAARAQGHHGPGGHGGGHVVVAASPYYGPWWYDGWYGYPFGYPYFYGYPPPFGYALYDRAASLRLQVEPRETEVYVDGYFAGTVDEFDGFFQRLDLAPGQHDLELYLQGYRSVRQQIFLQPGNTFRIRHTMQPLQPGDTPDERPTPQAPPPGAPPPPGTQPPTDALGRPQQRPEPPRGPDASSSFGSVAVRVQPADAEVLIDGDVWQTSGVASLVVQVSAGEHQIEVRKKGFQTFRSSVQVRRGETTPINVSLTRE
jgi:hypothetical protein